MFFLSSIARLIVKEFGIFTFTSLIAKAVPKKGVIARFEIICNGNSF
jgi:hypothetical protein